ncbi:MAG TPA: FliH/SctL family protein [Terriglobia bacterium]|nr:FliH/SctL family protein [Terriglobia bacterium]
MASRIIRGNSEELKNILSFSFEIAEAAEPAPQKIESPVVFTDSPPIHAPVSMEGQEQGLVDSVQEQAEALLRKAQLQAAEIEKEAYERGFNEGQKAGKEVGEKMVEASLKQYALTLEELGNLRTQVLSASEREVVRLALEIARKVVKREVTIDEDIILALVKVAMKRLGEESVMTVRLNPRDVQSILRLRNGAGGSVLSEAIQLVEDPLISRGGCLIETESGIIDGRVEEQFREIEKGFFE